MNAFLSSGSDKQKIPFFLPLNMNDFVVGLILFPGVFLLQISLKAQKSRPPQHSTAVHQNETGNLPHDYTEKREEKDLYQSKDSRKPKKFPLHVSVKPKKSATLQISPERKAYPKNSVVRITVQPKDGWVFVKWGDGKTNISRQFRIKKKTHLTAHLVKAGSTEWSAQLNGEIHSPVCAGPDGTIYTGTSAGEIYALKVGGAIKWNTKLAPGRISSPARYRTGNLYLTSASGKIYNLDSEGNVVWSINIQSRGFCSPAIGKTGKIYVGSPNGHLYAISPGGKILWKYDTGGEVYSSPAISPDGTVFVGSYSNKLIALTKDGKKLWSVSTNGPIYSSPSLDRNRNRVYIGSMDGNLYAIDLQGNINWKIATGGAVGSSTAIDSSGIVYAGSSSGKLFAIKPSGKIHWSFSIPYGKFYGSPAIGDIGNIYIKSSRGDLFSLKKDGSKAWQVHVGDGTSPVIDGAGRLLIGTLDGKLLSLHTTAMGPLASGWPMFGHDASHRGRFK